jgi:hypothetical protein
MEMRTIQIAVCLTAVFTGVIALGSAISIYDRAAFVGRKWIQERKVEAERKEQIESDAAFHRREVQERAAYVSWQNLTSDERAKHCKNKHGAKAYVSGMGCCAPRGDRDVCYTSTGLVIQ